MHDPAFEPSPLSQALQYYLVIYLRRLQFNDVISRTRLVRVRKDGVNLNTFYDLPVFLLSDGIHRM